MRQVTLGKRLLKRCLPALMIVGVMALPSVVMAAGTLVVTPSTNLSDGQTLSVSASGLAKSSTGAVLECNSDPSQPTIMVAGNPVPVSCTNPLTALSTTSKTGVLATTSFTVHTGTVGPPGTGKDSSGGNAATDAASYPCPPTAAQIAAGDSCIITFGDAGGDDLSQNITFSSQTPAAPTPKTPAATTPSTPAKTSTTTTTPSTLTNTGPGDTVGLFVGIVIAGALAHYTYRRFKTV